jgi:hypothetical protein
MERPIPELPPVTNATLSLNLMGHLSSIRRALANLDQYLMDADCPRRGLRYCGEIPQRWNAGCPQFSPVYAP